MTPPSPLLDQARPEVAEATSAATPTPTDGPVHAVPPATPGPLRAAALAAGIATAGAGAALGTLFVGARAPATAALAALAGAGLVAWGTGGRRTATTQWAALPLALVLGALAALGPGGGGGATLPAMVRDALFSGGLSQPPVPFDPGWRLVLVVVAFLLGVGSASVAVAWRSANLGVGVAVPVVALGALAQPPDGGAGAVVAGLVGIVGGLVVAYGVQVAQEDAGAGLQPRRVLRGLGAMAALALGLVVLARAATFLLPEPSDTRVIPPQRPPVAPPAEDVELFTVEADRALPWRLGVLDVYEDGAWKTPPFDVARFEPAPDAGAAPAGVTATFEVRGLAGRSLPGLARPTGVVGAAGGAITIDPRTESLRHERLVGDQVAYTVHAPPPATGEQLAAAGPPPAEMEPFLQVPPPPPEVQALLAEVGSTPSAFARLQAVRQAWYDRVVAAGVGDPVDVPAERVAAVLRGAAGGEASPWEIVAGEALLARWAGVPARLGYGWAGGDPVDGGWSIRPRHGAVWLEAWFDGVGWEPLVGKPPRAKASLSDAPKNDDAAVRPTDELALVTYVPIQRQDVTLLFEVVRHWVVRVVPAVLAAVLAWAVAPVARRALRRRRWLRYARRQGPAATALAHYAVLRDRAWDLNVGQPSMTPLEFADAVRPDPEHGELAWLVTRVLWGDLADVADEEHVEEVRRMSGSVARRLVQAQSGVARLVAAASRASLRRPYAAELDEATRRSRRSRRLPGRRRLAAAATALGALLASGCGEAVDLSTGAPPDVLPAVLVPERVDDVRFEREPEAEVPFEEAGERALVDHGRVWSVRVDDAIEASLQVVALRPGAVDRFEEVREGLLRELGGGRFEPTRVGEDTALAVETTEQRLLLWFDPDGAWYQLLVARRSFERADEVFAAVLATQRGQRVTSLEQLGRRLRVDGRRGIP